jgi:orotidine-5'-phosphate decarboxylase
VLLSELSHIGPDASAVPMTLKSLQSSASKLRSYWHPGQTMVKKALCFLLPIFVDVKRSDIGMTD